MKIIVNGEDQTWDCCIITYSEVVNLAYPGAREGFTVTYDGARKGAGTLIDRPEDEIEAQEGMVFDVANTGRA